MAALDSGERPRVIQLDNRPEFISHALARCAAEADTIQANIPSGQPWHNAFIESFHNRMLDELFEDNGTDSIDHARQLISDWAHRYIHFHTHSSQGYFSPAHYAEQWKNHHTANT